MKLPFTLLLAACGLANLCFANSHSGDWPVREQETIQKTLTLSGQPMRVVVDNVDGFVHVTGTGGSQVRLNAHKAIRAETDSDLQQAKSDVKLNIEEKPGSVSIYYDAPWRCNGDNGGCHGDHRHFYNVTYDITVEVPREARIVISTVNGGDITIENVTGNFDVKNINGSIKMAGVSGSGEAHTINGPVTARFSKNPSGTSSFKSINGQLDVSFQPGLSADLLFKTFNGQIYSDFDVTARDVAVPQPEIRNGKYVYHSNGLKGARVGRGGPEISFDAFNGNIRLHRAQGGANE